MAVNYKFIDEKIGLSSAGALPPAATQWAANTAYTTNSVVQNGGFIFRCSVAGTSAASVGPGPNVLTDNTVTWVLVGPVSPLCASDSVADPSTGLIQRHELGYIALGKDATYGIGEFMYVKFTGTVNPGDFVVIDQQALTCVQAPTSAPGASKFSHIGISMGTQASGTYGWVLIRGTHDQANVTAALTVGTVMSGGGASVGRANQAVANYIFDGCVLKAAGVAGQGTVYCYWPTCSGR